jgi:hypothetical protein
MDSNKNYVRIIKFDIVVHQQQLVKQQLQQHFEHRLLVPKLAVVKLLHHQLYVLLAVLKLFQIRGHGLFH